MPLVTIDVIKDVFTPKQKQQPMTTRTKTRWYEFAILMSLAVLTATLACTLMTVARATQIVA